MSTQRLLRIAAAVSVGFASVVQAGETITYTYDAVGRLIKVVRSGSVNNGIVTDYNHDKANNRNDVKVTGASR